MNEEVLVKVEGVSKKFCKDLKKSLKYGIKDLGSAIFSGKVKRELRPLEFWAVKEVSFELRRGECIGLIGHNGAGKSTLLKMLNGLIKPDRGSIEMYGRVGALIELGAGFNPILTGRENIYNNGAVLGFTKKEIDNKLESIIEFSEIGEFINSPVQNYSSGMKVRLGFAVAAQMEPDVLIIDEVLAVGDVGFRMKCVNAIGELMKNAAVIFVSHSMPQIYRLCTEVMLMDHGKKVYHGQQIGKGVELYYEMFDNEEEQVIGSGEARILNFKLSISEQLGQEENNILLVPHGSDLIVNMDVELETHIPAASIQMVIWNQELFPVIDILGENLKGYHLANNNKGRHNIQLKIPNVSLNTGTHSITLLVNSTDMDRNYCRYDNVAVFNMSTHFASGAHILLPLEWNEN